MMDMRTTVSPIPTNIQEAIIRDTNHLPQTPWLFQQDFRDNIVTGFSAFWKACRTLLVKSHPIATLALTLDDIDGERSTWSRSQQIAYASKEALKPLFTKGSSVLMQECAKYLGVQFVEFVRSAFMSELTGFLIEYLADQLYTYLGGGGGNGNNFDFVTWLEELIIFLLCYFIVLLLCRIHPDMVLLKNFFDVIVPMFVKYLIGKIRSKK